LARRVVTNPAGVGVGDTVAVGIEVGAAVGAGFGPPPPRPLPPQEVAATINEVVTRNIHHRDIGLFSSIRRNRL
jgi:hypothetical protein